MKGNISFQGTFVFLLLVFLIPMRPVHAEIYKWIDESGNVHFGDKPKDSAILQSSEKVELKESYVPGEGLSPEEVEAQKVFLRGKDIEREQQKQDAQKAEIEREEVRAQCKSMRDRLEDFTNIRMQDGRRTGVDYFVEDGKSVSAKRQKELVADLQEKVDKKCGQKY